MVTYTYHSAVGMLLPIFLLLCSLSGFPSVRCDDPSFTVYMFEQFVTVDGTNATNIIASPSDGDVTAMVWGNLAVAEMPVRASADPADPIIGNSPALFFPQKKSLHFTVFKMVTLSTELYKGTLFVSSDFDFNVLTDFVSEVYFVVGGGTGSFRDVSGYIAVTLVNSTSVSRVYKYDAYLSTCVRTSVTFT
ncbi:hypothetical protein R1flu_002387 [Riccia fluitans]|uniref:Dirigent protein n=1 Tax=Riccia fluitans TaxID=41844 RepID=A0ABD1Y5Z7_9MARC